MMNFRMQAEREITLATIQAALARGYTLHGVDIGEGRELCATVEKAMELAFEGDEANITLTHPAHEGFSWIYIVLGNSGWDVVSDYTIDLDEAVKATDALVEKWEEGLS